MAGGHEGAVLREGAPGVEDPEPVFCVEDYGLYANEVVLVVCACGWAGGVVYTATWWVVYLSRRVGFLCTVSSEFGNSVFSVGAVVGVVHVEAGRVIGEFAAAPGNRYALRLSA